MIQLSLQSHKEYIRMNQKNTAQEDIKCTFFLKISVGQKVVGQTSNTQ